MVSPDRFNPLPHDSQTWESILGLPVAGAHGGLSPQIYDTHVVQKKNPFRGPKPTHRVINLSLLTHLP